MISFVFKVIFVLPLMGLTIYVSVNLIKENDQKCLQTAIILTSISV